MSFSQVKWFFLGTLRRQLTFSMVVVVALAMSVFVWDQTRRQQALMLQVQSDQAAALASNVAASSAVWVASRDFAGLQEIISSLAAYPDLQHAIVLDMRGEVLAHTDALRRGLYLLDLPTQQEPQVIRRGATGIEALSPVLLGSQHIGWVRIALTGASTHRKLAEVARQGALNALIATLLCAALATLAGRYMTRRLAAIQRVANAVEAGAADQRAQLDGTDEAADLARQFNGMLDSLAHREQALRIAAAAFEAQDGIMVTDRSGTILRVNQAFCEMTGYTSEEAVGRHARMLDSGRQDSEFLAGMEARIEETGEWQGEVWNRRKNGELYAEWLTVTGVADANGDVTHYVRTMTDITERKATEREIRNLAFFDPLTGLPNRRLLIDRLQHAMAMATREAHAGALLFIDLDNFKTLNDSRGHEIGDELLQQVAARISRCLRDIDTVSRLGGDEFVVLLDKLGENATTAMTAAGIVGEKILAAIDEPYLIAGQQHRSTASVGVAIFDSTSAGSDDLLRKADLAMYEAKSAGRNALRFFDPAMQAEVSARAALESELQVAIREGQLELYFQAQVDVTGAIAGAEVLVRWHHPERGLVLPDEFIPMAEDSGLILPIGYWVIQEACRQLAAWAGQPVLGRLNLAVNVSARQFNHPNFVTQLLALVRSSRAEPRQLMLELTESVLLEDTSEAIQRMQTLKAFGLGFALDDFGTGYSSLASLKRLPLDQIKIDQSFVRDILTDPNDAAISNMIVVLARTLGIPVIAEGVETPAQRARLAAQGCLAYQGHLFSRPLPLAEFEALVHTAAGSPSALGEPQAAVESKAKSASLRT